MDRIGRYKIVRELGRGAMGVVYHAIDPNIGRPVAIKTIYFGENLKPEDRDRMRERLFREARSAGMLSHPGIITIYDVEQQGELAYIAMEFVDGPTLDQVLSESQPPPQDRLIGILGQTAAALDYAHSKGIVHRDIKPANIMLAADGTAKVADFGIAKLATAENLTMTGSIVGTPHYMSPEQVQGLAVDGRSDQFSLAVIAYEMLTGEKPFTGEHLTTVVYKIVAEEPMSAHRLNATLSAAIEHALRKALAKKPDARYRNCNEFIQALDKACTASKGWKLMPRGAMLSEPTMVGARPLATTLPPPRHAARSGESTATAATVATRRGGFLSFLLAILMAAGLLALIGWQASPWIMPGGKVSQQPPLETSVTDSKPEAATPGVVPQTAPAEIKPSPVGPVDAPAEAKPTETKPEAEPVARPEVKAETKSEPVPGQPEPKPDRSVPVKPAVKLEAEPKRAERRAVLPERTPVSQEVAILSSPGGARATLDGNPAASCITPCTLNAAAGKHTISFVLPGYSIERREISVGTASLELAPVVMKALGGTLMLTSVPSGAAVSVNGKASGLVTPARISLAPGTYAITVAKDGREATEKVQIRDRIASLQIALGQ